jgi:hypothetical protein
MRRRIHVSYEEEGTCVMRRRIHTWREAAVLP